MRILRYYIALIFIFSGCLRMKENIIVDKMINQNYCIGHSLNDNFFGLYKYNWSFSENVSCDTVILWDQICFTSDNIFVSNNYIILEKKRKRKTDFIVYTIKNDSVLEKVLTNQYDSFFVKFNFYNITDSIKKFHNAW